MKKKLLKETTWGFLSKGVTFVLYFLLNTILARNLGIEKFGLWSFFFSTFTIILLISHFGVNTSIKKFVAQYAKSELFAQALKDSIKIRLTFTIFFAIILALVAKPLAGLLGKPELSKLFLLASPMLVFTSLTEFVKKVFEGLHRIKYNFLLNLIEYGLKLSLVLIIIQKPLELTGIVNSFILATIATTFIGFTIVYLKYYKNQKLAKDKKLTKAIVKYSIQLFVINIGFVISTELDTFLLGILSSQEQVGAFAAVKQLVNKLPHISTAIAIGTMPVFANLNKNNLKKLKNLFKRIIKINMYIYGTIALIVVFLAPYLIPLIFGDQYSGSILPFQILIFYSVTFAFSIQISSFLDYRGLARKRVKNLILIIFLNLLLNFLLIPRYGAVGAAIGTSVSYLPYVILNYFEVKQEFKKIS
jgi:O-antigen/teichoic acid export membrane protein